MWEQAKDKSEDIKEQAKIETKPYIDAISERLNQIDNNYPEKSTLSQIKDFTNRIRYSFSHPSDSYITNQVANSAI